MSLFHIAILALVQGITEYLPVSSSGHLLLAHTILDGTANADAWGTDLILDLAVHVGSLAATLLYFRGDILKMLRGLPKLAVGNLTDFEPRLAAFLILASVPALAFGLILHLWQPSFLRSVEVVAWCTLTFGILLWVIDARSPATREIRDMKKREALIIGVAQAFSLIPGTSRSGITMTAARHLGFSRTEAAHFSFLLALIATSAAGAIGALDLIKAESIELTYDAAVAAILSFVTSLLTIVFLMKILRTWTFKPFAIYRILLGLLLLGLIYTGYLDDAIASMTSVSP